MDNVSAFACTDIESGIRALPNRKNETTNNGVNSAILRYAGAYAGDPTTSDTSGNLPLVETNLHVRPFLVLGYGAVLMICFCFL